MAIKNPFSRDALKRLGKAGLEELRETVGSLLESGGRLAAASGKIVKPQRNPVGKAAVKKARAWYQKENLVTGAQVINLPDTVEAVEIGRMVSITYESDKYDGVKRLWRHDVTGNKTLHISLDGKVLVVLPGFKVTKRGIEG